MFHVLFLCTGNSCRSILAEAYLNHIGGGSFRAFSAGSHPTGEVNPNSLKILQRQGIDTEGLHSKSIAAVADTRFDLVVTVCDNAAGESCPVFLGAPAKLHWGVSDPAYFVGDEESTMAEFERVFSLLKKPIAALTRLDTRKDSTAILKDLTSITVPDHA